jgi:hypothetical protein
MEEVEGSADDERASPRKRLAMFNTEGDGFRNRHRWGLVPDLLHAPNLGRIWVEAMVG